MQRDGSLALGPAVCLTDAELSSLERLSAEGWTVGVVRAFAGASLGVIVRRGGDEFRVAAPIGRRSLRLASFGSTSR